MANAGATDVRNQFQVQNVQLSGTPYTTITAAMDAVKGKAAIKAAIAGLLVSVGALPASFASS